MEGLGLIHKQKKHFTTNHIGKGLGWGLLSFAFCSGRMRRGFRVVLELGLGLLGVCVCVWNKCDLLGVGRKRG